MAIEEFTVNQNTAAVSQATAGMGAGQVDEIERQARAQVMTGREESAKADAAERSLHAAPSGGAAGSGGTEAKVYGDIVMDALGLKTLSTAAELIGDRIDAAGGGLAAGKAKGVIGAAAQTFDDHIKGASRAPGHYGASSGAKPGEDLLARMNITKSSLHEQGASAIKSWDVKEPKMNSVAQAKQLTFTRENSNELALQSVQKVRAQHSAMLYQANQLAPGMGMSGPKYVSPEEALRRAKETETKSVG